MRCYGRGMEFLALTGVFHGWVYQSKVCTYIHAIETINSQKISSLLYSVVIVCIHRLLELFLNLARSAKPSGRHVFAATATKSTFSGSQFRNDKTSSQCCCSLNHLDKFHRSQSNPRSGACAAITYISAFQSRRQSPRACLHSKGPVHLPSLNDRCRVQSSFARWLPGDHFEAWRDKKS